MTVPLCKALQRRLLAGSVLAVALTLGVVGAAQTGENCLGNSGERTVPTGTSYTDRSGRWECQPEDRRATAGGWVLIKTTPTPTATDSPTVTETPSPSPTSTSAPKTSPTSRSEIETATPAVAEGGTQRPGQALLSVGLVIAAVIAVSTATGALALRRFRRPRLSGWLIIEEEHHD